MTIEDKHQEHVTCVDCYRKEDCPSRTAKVNYSDLKRIKEIINDRGLIDLGEVNDILDKYM